LDLWSESQNFVESNIAKYRLNSALSSERLSELWDRERLLTKFQLVDALKKLTDSKGRYGFYHGTPHEKSQFWNPILTVNKKNNFLRYF